MLLGFFLSLSGAAKALAGARVAVTVIDRANHHLFRPLLYQLATAGHSAPAIAPPIRHILRRQKNLVVLMGEVQAIDAERRVVAVDDGADIAYDFLIVATGATHSYFGHDDWARYAPGLKTLDDALEIRRRVLLAFERAEREIDATRRALRSWTANCTAACTSTSATIPRSALSGRLQHGSPHPSARW
jgi:NADH dehydrogenase